jgi:hypothetical protein
MKIAKYNKVVNCKNYKSLEKKIYILLKINVKLMKKNFRNKYKKLMLKRKNRILN